MITIFKWSESRFIPTDKIARHCLVNVVNPDKSELEILSGEMRIPIDFLTDPLDVDERARVESEDGSLLIISNNLNVVMRILTSITIIMMIPTLTASIYGMNIELPFQHSPHPFYIVIGISFCTVLICVLIFIKKKWI